MQQSTIFSILLILLNKRKVSRDFIAERFSISKRTVTRYLAVLEDAGVPIVSVAGRGGGIALADDYMLDRTFLSEAETIRLKDALMRTADSYGDKANAALCEKLDAIDKSRGQDEYTVKQEGLYIACNYGEAQTLRPKIKLLSQAIELTRSADIKYTDARGCVSYRTIDPYTLVFKSGAWYIYAFCKLRGDFRLFKLSRISDIRLTSKRFVKYESRLAEKLELEFYNEVFIDLEFEFFSSVREDIVDWLGMGAITERGTKLVACAELPLTDSLYRKLLSFGSSVKVLSPPELAQKLYDESLLMQRIYE